MAALSQKTDLAPSVVKTVIGAMTSAAQHVSTDQFVQAVVAFCQGQETLEKVSESTVKAFLKLPGINEEMTVACRWYGSERLLILRRRGHLREIPIRTGRRRRGLSSERSGSSVMHRV